MKKIILILVVMAAFSCGGENKNQSETTSGSANSEENVEENSGANISPQLEDSASRLQVDTVGSPSQAPEADSLSGN